MPPSNPNQSPYQSNYPPPPPAQSAPPPIEHNISDELLEPSEKIVSIVGHHPLGIVFIYLEALAGVFAIVLFAVLLSPTFLENLSGSAYRLMIAIVGVVIAPLVLILLVATYIYRQ